MEKIKQFTIKNRLAITLIIVIAGLLREVLRIGTSELNVWVYRFLNLFTTSRFRINSITYSNYNTDFYIGLSDFLNVVYFVLFILGLYLLYKSNEKESRLIRFCYAILIGLAFISIIEKVFILGKSLMGSLTIGLPPVTWYVYVLTDVLLLLVVFYMLSYYNSLKELIKNTDEYINDFKKYSSRAYASMGQRFFHYITDTVIFFILIYFNFFSTARIFFFDDYNEVMNNETTMTLVMMIVPIILFFGYYFFFELFLGATPAKFLTETRVISRNREGKLKPLNILIRSVSRKIPFNPLSFLSSEEGYKKGSRTLQENDMYRVIGWHDQLSNTVVAKEVNDGISGKRYLWILLIVFLALIIYLVKAFVDSVYGLF